MYINYIRFSEQQQACLKSKSCCKGYGYCLRTKVASRAYGWPPYAFACWGVSPIPIEMMINHRATLPLGADKITVQLTAVPVIFLLPFAPAPVPKVDRYSPLQSEYPAFLFSPHGPVRMLFFAKASLHIRLAGFIFKTNAVRYFGNRPTTTKKISKLFSTVKRGGIKDNVIMNMGFVY